MTDVQMVRLEDEIEDPYKNYKTPIKQSLNDDIVFNLQEFSSYTSASQQKRIQKMAVQQIYEKNDRLGRIKTFKRETDIRNNSKLQNLNMSKKSELYNKKNIITIISTIFQGLMAFLASILYIVNTYYMEDKDMEPTFVFCETVIGLVFLADYLWNFYRSQDKIKFFFKLRNITDLITIIPTQLNYFPSLSSEVTLFLAGFVGIVRVTRIFRVFRIYKLFKEDQEQNYSLREYWEVKRKQLVIISQLFVSLLIAAGLIQAFHEFDFGFQIGPRQKLPFDAALYYITVTCSTVGYGDLTPANELSQVIVLLFIVSIIFIITKTTTDFNELSNITSKYKLPYEGHQKKHVFLIGNVNPGNFLTFAKEFYHPDICQDPETPILIMLQDEPNNEWRSIFKTSQFQGKVYYIVGNPLKKSDLQLAKLSSNKVMILVDQFSKQSNQEDAFALLATQFISDLYPRCSIFTQINSKHNLFWNQWHGQKSISSSNLLKMGAISQNVFIPGFSTFINNLSMSLSEQNLQVLDYSPWKLEYISGMSNEIYIFEFREDRHNIYIGKSFQQACLEIYNKTGILMIGVKIKNRQLSQESDHYDIVINPIDYCINAEDSAILLAKSYQDCQQIFFTASNDLGNLRENDQYFTTYHKINGRIQPHIFSKQSEGKLQQTFFKMSRVDMRKYINNHILILGELDFAEQLIEELRSKTNITICYVSKLPPDENWEKIKRRFTKLYYFECQYFNIDELERTSIRNSFHTIILCGPEGSEFADSRLLPLANIIAENFSDINFTLELRREKNVKYIMNKALEEGINRKSNNLIQNSYTNPLFAASKLFYSASINYSMARCLHVENFGEVLEKLISPHLHPNLSKIKENNSFSYAEIPYTLSNLYTYQQVFDYFIGNNIIPVALYRKQNALDNEEDFIYTNPNPQAPILKGDLLILIGNTKYNKTEVNTEIDVNIEEEQQIKQTQLTLDNPQLNRRQSKKQIDQVKTNVVRLIPELSVFGEDRDSNDQKGLSRLESISKTLIDMNHKFSLYNNEMGQQKICDYLKTTPEQLDKLLQMNEQLSNLIDQNESLRLSFGREIINKCITTQNLSMNLLHNYQSPNKL